MGRAISSRAWLILWRASRAGGHIKDGKGVGGSSRDDAAELVDDESYYIGEGGEGEELK